MRRLRNNRGSERGATTVEYGLLMAGVALAGALAVTQVGPAIRDQLTVTQSAIGARDVGDGDECPDGWDLVVDRQLKKEGVQVDRNQDGFICRKQNPDGSPGNSNKPEHLEDNNK